MFKNIVKIISFFILLSLITTSNILAFHKENSETTIQTTEWNGDSKSKKAFENIEKQKSCALKASAFLIPGKPVINQNTKEQTLDENGKKVFEKDTFAMEITGYHLQKAKNTGGKLQPNLHKLNFDANWSKLRLVDLLKMYCVQDSSKEIRPTQFKGSYLENLYKDIALDNGFVKINNDGNEEGDYSKKIYDGPLGADILKPENGIKINNSNVVWYVPDFLIDTYRKNKKDEAEARKKKKAEEEKQKKKQARNNAIKKGKEKWISENKQNYIDQFIVKLNEYSKIIQNLEDNRKRLNARVKEYEKLTEEANEEIEIAFDDLANINQEIKDKKSKIRKNKKIYLSKVNLESFEDRLKEINSINFKKYDNYLKLKKIKNKAEDSTKPEDFLGKDGLKIPLPKIAGGGNFKLTSDKLGFIEEFENLKDKSLGSGSKTHSSNMIELSKEIINSTNDIDEFIFKPVDELVAYDNALEEEKAKTPWGTYAIYLVIFLVVIGSILSLILYQRKQKEDLKEEAEEKLVSLKSDLESKLKHTSEQIRSVKTSSTNQSHSQTEAQPAVEEAPKTPEQIIADKYDELISDYNEALDDFSKVAGFKQKWNGLALSRKERQEGTKTVLISSSRAFEKAGIWCVTFSDKYFGLPGLSVKTNMATYMNLNFMKADQDFKGIFSISEGSSYSTEPCVLRKGGAGFVVERSGKIIFPN